MKQWPADRRALELFRSKEADDLYERFGSETLMELIEEALLSGTDDVWGRIKAAEEAAGAD